jgi:hypothetical protein
MKNHFSKEHQGLKCSEWIQKCQVQSPFKGRYTKYFQVELIQDLEIEGIQQEDWMLNLRNDFKDLLAKGDTEELDEVMDLRLMGTFIAKIRWDLAIKDLNTKVLIDFTGTPTIRNKYHRILLCGRRYIKECCKKLARGNMMIRRKLMSVRYYNNLRRKLSSSENKGKNYFNALKEISS